jgi:hypothetical protein
MNGKTNLQEKGVGIASPSNNASIPEYDSDNTEVTHEKLGFWTRVGCTPESFKRRTSSKDDNLLNHTLKPCHLHIIAISGSTGAGFFCWFRGCSLQGCTILKIDQWAGKHRLKSQS